MGLLDKKSVAKKPEKVVLDTIELEYLLKLIAESKFDGKDVQVVYSTAVKLQKLLTE